MEDILDILDAKGEMKKNELYGLLKTNSKIINSEILKKIKFFNKIDDFFGHYSKQTPLFELLNKIELSSSKNYDEKFLTFDSATEQYISCLTQIILSIKIILKAQEILYKIFISSKQYLSELKTDHQIENISQDNLFYIIENLLYINEKKTSRSNSNSTPTLKESSNSINNKLLYHQKITNCQSFKPFSCNDVGKNISFMYEEPCTPTFCSKSDVSFHNFQKGSCPNIHIRNDSSLTLSCEQDIKLYEEHKDLAKDKINNSAEKDAVYNNTIDEKKYENLLEMINIIYRKCIINSEEKVRLKQLVLGKSEEVENLYYNIYKNKPLDENILRAEITKLIN